MGASSSKAKKEYKPKEIKLNIQLQLGQKNGGIINLPNNNNDIINKLKEGDAPPSYEDSINYSSSDNTSAPKTRLSIQSQNFNKQMILEGSNPNIVIPLSFENINNNNNNNYNNINNNNLGINTQNGRDIDINIGGNRIIDTQKETTKDGNIDINRGINKMEIGKKETEKYSETKGNIDPNSRGNRNFYGEQGSNFYTKPGNIDINIGGDKKIQEFNNSSNTNKGNIDINIGGDKKIQEFNNSSNTNKGNIDINLGGNKKIEDFNKPSITNKGNIDINLGGNKKIEDFNNPSITNKGNIDINLGGNKKIEDFNNPSITNKGNIDINSNEIKKNDEIFKKDIDKQNYFDNNDLSMSNSCILTYSFSNVDLKSEEFKRVIDKKINEGYFPLFLKLDNRKPRFFFVKNQITLKTVLNNYLILNRISNTGKKYILYNKDKELDQDIPVIDLNIKKLGMIKNIKQD